MNATAIETACKEHGIVFDIGTMRFSDRTFGAKLEARLSSEALASRQDVDEAEFRALASIYGLSPDDFGRTFAYNRKVFRVCGLKTQNRQNPIIAEQVGTTKRFKFPASTVKAFLPNQSQGATATL